MAYRTNSRLVPIIIIFVIIIIAVVALISVGRAVFTGSNQSKVTVIDTSEAALLDTTADRTVRMTVRGAIVANESFRSYRIEVTPSSRTLTTYNSYLDTVVDTVALGNNVPAYDEFVHALSRANLTKGTQFTGSKDDTRGICAAGHVYEFEIMNGDTIVKRLWTSTCDGSKGSLNASKDQLANLFVEQIPGAPALISKIEL